MQQKLWLEDLSVGQEFLSGTHKLTADEIKEFAGRYDPQPFHTDEAAARNTMFGGLAASGWHTAAVTMKLSVQSFPLASGIIGSGGELRWPWRGSFSALNLAVTGGRRKPFLAQMTVAWYATPTACDAVLCLSWSTV